MADRANHAYVVRAALRYTLGSRTYGPGMVQEYIRDHMDALLPTEREAMAAEIDQAETERRLGDETIDLPGWLALRDALRGGE